MHSDSGKVDEAAHVQATGQAHDQRTVTDGPIKLTVLYGHPTDPAAFERYYAGTHMPLVRKIQGVRTEQAKVIGSPDGSTPTHYRIFEFWFDDQQHMQQAMGSLEAQAAVADVPNFASGGVSILVSQIE